MHESIVAHIDSYEHKGGVNPATPVFAKKGDVFISTQYSDINTKYLSYLAGLTSINGKKNVFPSINDITLIVPQGEGSTTAEKLLNDGQSLEQLKKLTSNSQLLGLACFAIASELRPDDNSISKIAKEVNIPLLSGNYEVFHQNGGKSGSRKLFRELGLRTPHGLEDISEEKIRHGWKHFHLANPNGFWIKANWGAAEFRNIYIAPLVSHEQLETFNKLASGYKGDYIVEDHIPDAVSFPAALVQIDESGVSISDIHEQTGVGISTYYKPDKHDREYFSRHPFAGPPKWWADNKLRLRFKDEAVKIGKKLQELGWVGMVCIDSILDNNGNIYWDEINFRMGGSTPVIEALRRINDVLQEVCLEDAGVSFKIEHLKNNTLSFTELAGRLSKYLYSEKKKNGLLLLNADYYPKYGIDLVAFGQRIDQSDLNLLIEKGLKTL